MAASWLFPGVGKTLRIAGFQRLSGVRARWWRVRAAAGMLAQGALVHDVVSRLGYYDEPHLARMLRRYVGRSAQQLRAADGGAIALDSTHDTTS